MHDPKRGNVWYTAWRGDTKVTFSEDFAKLWLYQKQSQNVMSKDGKDGYADAADAETA